MVVTLLGYFTVVLTCFTLFVLFSLSYKNNHKYLLWFLGGFLYNFYTISLFYVFLPIPWIESTVAQYLGITFFILCGAVVSGVSFLVVPLLLQILSRFHLQKSFLPLLIFLAFVLQDILRSLFISLLLYGDGGSLGLHFILGSLGESLAFTPLVILAYKGGVYALTGVISLLTFLFFALYKKLFSAKEVFVYFSVLAVFTTLLYLRPLQHFEKKEVGILTTAWQNPSLEKNQKLTDYKKRAEVISKIIEEQKDHLDILLLPESTSYLDAKMLTTLSEDKNVDTILDSATIPKQNDYYTASIFYKEADDTREVRRKDVLMVFSEYNPFLSTLLMNLFLKKNSTDENIIYKRSGDYHSFDLKGVTFAALLCGEATSMMPILSFEKTAPDFYTLQSNLVVMRGRPLGFMHLQAYTRLVAATTGKIVLGVSNSAPSYGFNGKGEILYSLPPETSITRISIP